ncbi:hypothetical protein NDK43_26290 [Neobacillus pocheonensis]|uniref:DUF4179 domain-containing protein n=1 Tax=Neobacillus pocheonensis TaxID=363869 RepID=A0ABT0WIA2_9BACI|nr:hypothetical protein [Neobacillus pocheonensis]
MFLKQVAASLPRHSRCEPELIPQGQRIFLFLATILSGFALIKVPLVDSLLLLPVSFQEIEGQQVTVTSSYALDQDEKGEPVFGFAVGNDCDLSFPLICKSDYTTNILSFFLFNYPEN